MLKTLVTLNFIHHFTSNSIYISIRCLFVFIVGDSMSYDLYKGDCLVEMNNIEDHSIDMILCDLPYGTTACKWDITLPFDKLWEHYNRITKDESAILLFGSEPFSSYLRLSNIKNFRYDLIWCKNTSGGFINAKKQPMKYHEIISVFYKKQPVYNPIMQEFAESTKRRYGRNQKFTTPLRKNSIHGITMKPSDENTYIDLSRGRYPKSILEFNSVANSSKERVHPTQKPVELLEYLIKSFTDEGMTVLDNCMGSGSTGVACVNTNRNFIGIELDDNYFRIADNRLKEAMELKNESNSGIL